MSEPVNEEQESTRKQDPEVLLMGRIVRLIDDSGIDPAARERVCD